MDSKSRWRIRYSSILIVLFITFLGAFPRLIAPLSSNFPLNDGGMFYTMIRDLQSADYSLPSYTSYNGGQIPFVYPPLGFYLAGGLSAALHSSVLTCLRLLPPMLSVLTIPAFYFLGRTLLQDDTLAALASFAFATIPTTFDWGIMGGGLTRSLGFLFGLVTLQQIVSLLREPKAWRIPVTGLAASFTLLSHPSSTWFVAYSALILWAAYGRNRRSTTYLLGAGAATILLSSPWWLAVVNRHGFKPILAASGNAFTPMSSFIAAPLLQFTNQPLLALWPVLGLVGFLLCVTRRIWILPLWALVIAVIQGRGWPAYIEAPFALIVGVGLSDILWLVGASKSADRSVKPGWAQILDGPVPKLGLTYIIIFSLVAAYLAAPRSSLTKSQVEAMTWAGRHTPPTSSFAVISGSTDWAADAVSEWFPALSQRTSVTTPQGQEWEPHEFALRQANDIALQACASQTTNCLDRWEQASGISPEYIYLVNSPATVTLAASLSASYEFKSVYTSPGAEIFAHTVMPPTEG